MVNSPPKVDDNIDENDLFYFESDHLAVKGNKDYSELIKTLFVLQAQQKRAVIDFEKTAQIQRELLSDPLATVERLKNGDDLGIPPLQRIIEVPNINWSKYNITVPLEDLKSTENENTFKEVPKIETVPKGSQKKKPWTVEEQKRLEELLAIYPPEAIEIKRFKKIAAALGNRTTIQVCSRVQKYFLKLHQQGLPIPGRIPKYKHKPKAHKHQRFNNYLLKPTTFFPELNIPVVMNETEDVPGPSSSYSNDQTAQSNYLIPGSYLEATEPNTKTDAENQLDLLKRVREAKEKEKENASEICLHFGYKCNFCEEEPIPGTRWHCTTCTSTSIDFCTDCLVAQMYSNSCHPLSHSFAALRNDKPNVSMSYSESDSDSSHVENMDSDNGSDEDEENGVKGGIGGFVANGRKGGGEDGGDTPYGYLHGHLFGK